MRFRPLLALVLAFCLTVVTACSGGAQADERSNVTYDDIRNTGKANDRPPFGFCSWVYCSDPWC